MSPDLAQWIADANLDSILAELIVPFEFDLGAQGTAETKILIKNRIVLLSHPFGIVPSLARKIVPRLLSYVLSKATAANILDRCLKKVHILELIESETYVPVRISALSVPPTYHGSLLETLLPKGEGHITHLSFSTAIRISLPDLPPRTLLRQSLVAELISLLSKGFLYLYGSTGTGKSTLANLLSRQMPEEPLWIDLRGKTAEAVVLIRASTSHLLKSGKICGLVLDDVEFNGDSRALQGAISEVAAVIKILGGSLIITSSTRIPRSLESRLKAGGEIQVKVPYFSENEIEKLISKIGNIDQKRSESWSKIVYLQTTGHPQLVDARVQALANANFPDIASSELTSVPDDLVEVRDQVRELIALLPESQRDLLYRLSLSALTFRREVAFIVASFSPLIALPGDVFDAIVGPWIENVGGGSGFECHP